MELAVADELSVKRDVHALEDRDHLQRGDDLLELLDRPGPRRDAAVGDEPGGLVLPLLLQVIDRVLDRRRVAVVVLRGDEHDRVGAVDPGAPFVGVAEGVLAQPGMVRLFHQRQPDLGEVGHLDVEPAVGTGSVDEPLGDRLPGPAWADRADDDGEDRHGCWNSRSVRSCGFEAGTTQHSGPAKYCGSRPERSVHGRVWPAGSGWAEDVVPLWLADLVTGRIVVIGTPALL